MQSDVAQRSPAVPRPRSPGLSFTVGGVGAPPDGERAGERSPESIDAGVPRHWFGGNVVATQVANGVNLLFPAGERFFARSVNHYLDRVSDPLLRARARGFFGQEGRHAREHERVFEMMEAQGYDVRRFLGLYEAVAYGVIERVAPRALALSTTAACEHYTAILAEHALRDRLLDQAHPTMRALLYWHASEEIEHRDVAFDVLQAVHPGYALRVAGLAMATACLGGFWVAATLMLLAQEKDVALPRLRRDWGVARERSRRHGVFVKGIREYLRPGFHPSQKETDTLAADYLASVGLS